MRDSSTQDRSGKPPAQIHLAGRLALRPKEAAQVFGLSERALRALLPELPHVRAGGAVLLPVDLLREWLRQRADANGKDAESVADEVLRELEESS